MNAKPDGGPAFPENDGMGIVREGMSIREYAAIQFAAALIQTDRLLALRVRPQHSQVMHDAFALADAFISKNSQQYAPES